MSRGMNQRRAAMQRPPRRPSCHPTCNRRAKAQGIKQGLAANNTNRGHSGRARRGDPIRRVFHQSNSQFDSSRRTPPRGLEPRHGARALHIASSILKAYWPETMGRQSSFGRGHPVRSCAGYLPGATHGGGGQEEADVGYLAIDTCELRNSYDVRYEFDRRCRCSVLHADWMLPHALQVLAPPSVHRYILLGGTWPSARLALYDYVLLALAHTFDDDQPSWAR
eukprot:2166357-Prymnesium_polylepis.2